MSRDNLLWIPKSGLKEFNSRVIISFRQAQSLYNGTGWFLEEWMQVVKFVDFGQFIIVMYCWTKRLQEWRPVSYAASKLGESNFR